jgi:ketosteroid isomerase-like protein
MRGDLPFILDLITDDFELIFYGPSVIPWAGRHSGKEGLTQFATSIGESVTTEEFGPKEIYGDGDEVTVVGHERMKVNATGKIYDVEWAHLFTFRDGKLARVRDFQDTHSMATAFTP